MGGKDLKATVEKHDRHRVAVTVEVEAERFDAALDRAFRKVVQKVTVPGFRKGRVPRPIFEKRMGLGLLFDEALDELLPEAYAEAVKETGIEPVERPEIEVVQIDKHAPLIFRAIVTVKPEVTWPEGAERLKLQKIIRPVKEEDIEARLMEMREKVAVLETLEEGTVEYGDILTIDFEGFVDGKPIEGGKGERETLEIGSGRFLPDFESALVGKTVGETHEIEVTFPENYQSDALSGKTAQFRVTIHDRKTKRYPALDDDFARDVSEYETLAELRDAIRKEIEAEREKEAEEALRSEAVRRFAERVEVDLPDVMVHEEAHEMVHELEYALKQQGIPMALYYQVIQKDERMLIDEYREAATRRLRERLALEALADRVGIEIGDDEIEADIDKVAKAWNRSAEETRKILEGQGLLALLMRDVRFRKVVDWLLEHAEIETTRADVDETASPTEAADAAAKTGAADSAGADGDGGGEAAHNI